MGNHKKTAKSTDKVSSPTPSPSNSKQPLSTRNPFHIGPIDADDIEEIDGPPNNPTRPPTGPPAPTDSNFPPLPSSTAAENGARPSTAPTAPSSKEEKADPGVKSPLPPTSTASDASTTHVPTDTLAATTDAADSEQLDTDGDIDMTAASTSNSTSDSIPGPTSDSTQGHMMEDVNNLRKRKQGDTSSAPRPNGTQQPKKGKSQARTNAAAPGNSGQQQQQQDGNAAQQPAQSGQQQAAHPAILYPNPFKALAANVLSQQPPSVPGGQLAPLPTNAVASGSTQPASVSTGQATAPQSSNRPQQPAAQQQSDKKPKARALYASAEQMRQCGVTAEAETSLVLVLTAPTTERRGGRPAWSQLPKGNSNNPQSSNAIATLLAYLRVTLPSPLPQLYAQHTTLDSLLKAVQARLVPLEQVTQEQIDGFGLVQAKDADAKHHGAVLLHAAGSIAALDNNDTATHWEHILSPHSACMNRSTHPATALQPATDRCVIRLDFLTPLVRQCVGHHLASMGPAAAAAAVGASSSSSSSDNSAGSAGSNTNSAIRRPAGTPKATIEVQTYTRRMITMRVAGFPKGNSSTRPCHSSFSSFIEPVGNWPALQQYLREQAPNCYLHDKFHSLLQGTTAVTFTLERTYLHQLHALEGSINNMLSTPDGHRLGLTQRIHLSVDMRSPSLISVCSICGNTDHKGRECPKRPADGARTCRICVSTEHTAADCPAAATTICQTCNQPGHTGNSCSKTRPRWANIVLKTPSPAAPRSTHAADRIALLQRDPNKPLPDPAPLPQASTSQPARSYAQAAGGQRGQQTQRQTASPPPQHTANDNLLQLVLDSNRAMQKTFNLMMKQMLFMNAALLRLMPDLAGATADTPDAPLQPINLSQLHKQHSSIAAAPATTSTQPTATAPQPTQAGQQQQQQPTSGLTPRVSLTAQSLTHGSGNGLNIETANSNKFIFHAHPPTTTANGSTALTAQPSTAAGSEPAQPQQPLPPPYGPSPATNTMCQ